MNDEWAANNFKGIIKKLEEYVETDNKRKGEIIQLQNQVTMLTQEIMVLKQRFNVLQGTQVLGSTSK